MAAVFSFFCTGAALAAGDTPMRASASIGYDNNANLDAERRNDWFAETHFNIRHFRPAGDRARLRLFYDLLSLNYFDATDQSALRQNAGIGLDLPFSQATALEADYDFRYDYFEYDENGSALAHHGRAGLWHRLNKDMSLRAGFGVQEREFMDRKTHLASGILSDSKERQDIRYIADSELEWRLRKDFVFRAGGTWHRNDSNDLFHDYYDYDACQIYVASSFKLPPRFSKKLTGLARLSYEYRRYDSRPLLDHPGTFQRDDTYALTLGAFYNLSKSASLGLLSSYRERNSNEPSQSFSGLLSTLGVYYYF